MKASESQLTAPALAPTALGHTRQHRRLAYRKVHDERKRPIRGLWVRNGRYYAQITVEDPHSGQKDVRRIPLENVTTPAQAVSALEELKVKRRKGKLPILRRTPTFGDFAEQYVDFHTRLQDTKKASTLETEKYAIARWKAHLGQLRLDQIKRTHIDAYIVKRKDDGVAARTVNLEVTVLRNVLNRAIDQKHLERLPTENLRPLKSTRHKRGLFTAPEIEKLCSVGFTPCFQHGRLARAGETGQPLMNARQFSDYIKLLIYCGARLSEALRLRWSDVDWIKRQLTIGGEGNAKNRRWRTVDFNPQLGAHLTDMQARRVPDSDWLFPSPRRGEADRPAKTFRESLLLARAAVGLTKFAFHDCRHYFISQCVMAGVDYMTIAQWVGHRDGGILIGKVYGHLNNEHQQRMAQKLAL